MLRASDAPIPSTCSISAIAARSTPCSPPKCLSSARRRAGPRPGILSRIDSLKRFARRLRWPVIANRWASSRTPLDEAQRRGLRRQRARNILALNKQTLLPRATIRALRDPDQGQVGDSKVG